MIRYIGGKSRLAGKLAEAMRPYTIGKKRLIEPFFGGGGMLLAFQSLDLKHYATDINENLVLMFKAMQAGWKPPKTITEEKYAQLKTAPNSFLKTYAGYALSYGGKWFGGYMRDKQTGRNLQLESYNRYEKYLPALLNVSSLGAKPFGKWAAKPGDVFYCDIPYAGTLGYGTDFSHQDFWDCCRYWANSGAVVFVSEYVAPTDFVEVYSQSYSTCIHHKATNNTKTEKLFMVKA